MFNPCRRGATSICRALRTNPNISVRSIRSSTRISWTPNVKTTTSFQPIGVRYLHFTSSLRNSASTSVETQSELELLGQDHGEITKFDQLTERGLIDPVIIDEITNTMGHHTLTQVQSLTIESALTGSDIVAQARTGTGKTLGFLLPVIQRILNDDPSLKTRTQYGRFSKNNATDIRGIVISPTRELAEQIAAEARKLVRNTSVKVQVAVGGNSRRFMLERTKREGCHLLIATPGRLLDLLTDSYSGVSAPALKSLVLDEADRLLDIGFSEEIREIIRQLPDRSEVDRQTLLFSATMPEKVLDLVDNTLKARYEFVQTVHKGEQQTHEKVAQKIVEARGYENTMPALFELCKRNIEQTPDPTQPERPFKAIVFLAATANVQLTHAIFRNLRGDGVGRDRRHLLHPAKILMIHGKLSQRERTEASEIFRRAQSAILFSTDVTARGMDFPGVTHVIQVGLPPDAEQYIHRLGRTGRGSNPGEGYIIVSSSEMPLARRVLGRFPITRDTTIESASVDMTQEAKLSSGLAKILTDIGDATKGVDAKLKADAYRVGMSFASRANGHHNKQDIVDALNQWARFGWGWEVPPTLSLSTAKKLGISELRGLNFREERDPYGFNDNSARESDQFGRGDGESRGGYGNVRGDRRGSGNFRNDRGGRGDRFGGRGNGYGRGGWGNFGEDRGGDPQRASF